MSVSSFANISALYILYNQLSFLNEHRFNPLRDFKVIAVSFGVMMLVRGSGIVYMWSEMENIFNRVNEKVQKKQTIDYSSIDFYRNNINNPLKIFLYRNFF